MKRVKSISIINGKDSQIITDGINGIDRIEDKSMDFENSFYSMYLCFDSDSNLIKSIENCPVVVDYYKS